MVTLPTQNDLGFAAPRSSAGQTNINVGARGGTGEAVKYAGRTLEGVLGERKEREDRSELANAKLDFAKKSSEIRRDFSERQDYGVFEQEYETRIQDARAESLGLLSSGRNRDAFNVDSELSILRGGDNIHKMARGLEVNKGRADLQGMMADTRGLFLGSDNPAERDEYQRMVQDGLQSAVDNGYISETERLSQGQKYVRDLSRGMLDMEDARGKLDLLDNDRFMDFLDPDEKATFRRQAKKQIDVERRVAAAELRPMVQDHLASIQATGEGVEGVDARAARLLSGKDLASYKRNVREAKAYHSTFEQMKAATPEEIVSTLRSKAPVPGSEGFARDQKAYQTYQKSAQDIMSARAADPAGYVSQSDEIKGMVEAGSPQSEIVRARIEAQEAIGIPKVNQAAIPKSQVAGIISSIASAPAEERAAQLQSLDDEFGEAYPAVFADLVKGGLDPQTQILATISDDPASSQMLANAIDIGKKDLQGGLDPDTVKDIKSNARSNVQEFAEAFGARDYTGQAASKMNSLLESVELLALQHARSGMSASDAAEAAHKSIIGDRYAVVDTGTAHGFIPKVNGQPLVSEPKLMRAVEKALNPAEIKGFNPVSFSRSGGKEATSVEKAATLNAAEDFGYFVTNRDGTGFILLVPFSGGGALPLVNEDGENYEILFNVLAEQPEPIPEPFPTKGTRGGRF